jgi:Flp pilus assembly pilin Flp
MIKNLRSLYLQFPKTVKGQDLTEYGLLVALIAIIVVLAVLFFGDNVSSFYSLLGDTVSSWLS